MIKAASGLLLLYDYLWAREHERGEETGRKARPVCLQILIQTKGEGTTKPPVLLFPVTSQSPRPDQSAFPVPEIECKRAGLRHPAWVIVDEWNEDFVETSPSLASPNPIGQFGASFTREVRYAAIAAIKAGQHKRITRKS